MMPVISFTAPLQTLGGYEVFFAQTNIAIFSMIASKGCFLTPFWTSLTISWQSRQAGLKIEREDAKSRHNIRRIIVLDIGR